MAATTSEPIPRRWLDRPTRRLVTLLRAAQVGGPGARSAARRAPGLVAALRTHFDPAAAATRAGIELRLLAGQSDAEIANKVGLAADVVASYHDLFYAIRPRLAAPDDALFTAVGEPLYTGPVPAEAVRRLVCLAAGPVAADALCDPAAAAALAPALERLRLALSLPVDARTGRRVLELYACLGRLDAIRAAPAPPPRLPAGAATRGDRADARPRPPAEGHVGTPDGETDDAVRRSRAV
jgi:hypothetical protein